MACFYAILFTVYGIASFLLEEYALRGEGQSSILGSNPFIAMLIIALATFVAFLLGVLPSVGLGAITGWVIERAVRSTRDKLSSSTAVLLGLAICCAFALLLSLTLYSVGYDSNFVSLLLLPFIIYATTGGLMSWRLYTRTG